MTIKQQTFAKDAVSYPKGECCDACYYAKEERCVCRCGGKYHGLGVNKNKNKALEEFDGGEGEKR